MTFGIARAVNLIANARESGAIQQSKKFVIQPRALGVLDARMRGYGGGAGAPICPAGKSIKTRQALATKIFRFYRIRIWRICRLVPPDTRGVRVVTKRGLGCGGRGSVGATSEPQGGFP